MSKTFKNVAKN